MGSLWLTSLRPIGFGQDSCLSKNSTSGSSAGVSFTVQNDTEMVQSEFLRVRRFKDLVKELSEFLGFSIDLHVEKSKEKGVTDSEDVDKEKLWRKVRRVMSPVSSRRTSPSSWGVRRLTDLVVKLSEFIGFPIEFHVEKSKEKEVTDSGKNEDDNRGGR